jgi:hypothetical protein
MMRKLMVLGAGAVGYVLGAKAGRERYEQIAQQAQKLRSNPTVRQKVDEAKHVAQDAADQAKTKVQEKQSGSSGTSSSYSSSTTSTTPPAGTSPSSTSTPTGTAGPNL